MINFTYNNHLLHLLFCLVIILLSSSCSSPVENNSNDISLIEKRKQDIKEVILSGLPIILLNNNKQSVSLATQKKVLSDPNLKKKLFFDPKSGQALLNEVLSITALRPADITKNSTICRNKECLRYEIFNYALNGTGILTVLEETNEIIDFSYYAGMQGDISESLAELALSIAMNDPKVKKAYGAGLNPNDVRMVATKTALNRSNCQRSKHLCVAPTFVKDDKALWVVVDLTDLKVVGTKWTNVGKTGMVATERSVQNEHIMKCYCDIENKLKMDDWSIKYNLTRSDGLKVYDIFYKGNPILESIKMVDWHVSYSNTEGFGYSDAIGCPEFSQAAVIAVEAPFVKALIENNDTIGFALTQKYFSPGWPSPCSYNYQQEFHFFRDGSFRPIVGSLGRGCGINGIYRPVTRIAFHGNDHQYKTADANGQLKSWSKENWLYENEVFEYYDDNYIAQINGIGSKSFLMEANKGQFGDNSRGDNAYVYVTVNHEDKDEGKSDLPTIGPCCNTDYRQGPEQFMEEESLVNESIVIWYVPQMYNDNTPGKEYCWAESVLENGIYVDKVYPCFSGPKFKLIQ